jgi:hypothetical protein
MSGGDAATHQCLGYVGFRDIFSCCPRRTGCGRQRHFAPEGNRPVKRSRHPRKRQAYGPTDRLRGHC